MNNCIRTSVNLKKNWRHIIGKAKQYKYSYIVCNHLIMSCTQRLPPTICFTRRNKMTRFANRSHNSFISKFRNRSP